jgi:hypothetical protein
MDSNSILKNLSTIVLCSNSLLLRLYETPDEPEANALTNF